ncbi:MAG: tRNA (cytidine(56)-2'-O)-methyltransferase [Conexivisphaerales archaeon]
MSRLVVLRLGHRSTRDKRVTTHCGLVGRAFGADSMYYFGDKDETVENSIKKVVENWGGDFKVEWKQDPLQFINKWKREGGVCVHCTMYGVNINKMQGELRRMFSEKDIAIIIGASKVPLDIYKASDYNIAVGNQPHSEIAALAIVLDRIFKGKELVATFKDAKIKIIPKKEGKEVSRIEE